MRIQDSRPLAGSSSIPPGSNSRRSIGTTRCRERSPMHSRPLVRFCHDYPRSLSGSAPAEARDAIYAGISRADYIIQSSQRVESAMRAAPWRYPVQGRYFAQLDAGALGFQEVASSSSRPPLETSPSTTARPTSRSSTTTTRASRSTSALPRLLGPTTTRSCLGLATTLDSGPRARTAHLLLDGPVGENPSVDDARWSAAITGGPCQPSRSGS